MARWDEFESVQALYRREYPDHRGNCFHFEVYEIINSIGHHSSVYRNCLDGIYEWYSIKSEGRVRYFNIRRCDRLDIIRNNIIMSTMDALKLAVEKVVPEELLALVRFYAI